MVETEPRAPPGTPRERGREHWGSRTGFVLATIGAAAGLGNIWRFSYVAGESGGAAFLLVYLACVLVVCLPLVVAELGIGRRAQGDAVAAFEALAPGSAWFAAGLLAVSAAFLLLGYYGVIAGWALKYFVDAVLGTLWRVADADHGAHFARFVAHPWQPVLWQALMTGAAVLVVRGGVRRGIERANRVLMPVLGLMVLGLAIHGVSLEGSGRGLAFLFAPDWSALARPAVYLAAMGQAFFSIGIGMALYVTYGGYLTGAQRIPGAAGAIVAGDTLLAVAAGVAIFPAVFAFGLDPAAGPALAFITLPRLFLAMPGGAVVGAVFFFLLAVAALTSMVAILEIPAAYFIRRFRLQRRVAVPAIGFVSFLVGVPAALGFGPLADVTIGALDILGTMDFLVAGLAMPIGGLAMALFAGWRWGRARALEGSDLGDRALGRLWLWLLRLVVPVLIALVFLRAVALI